MDCKDCSIEDAEPANFRLPKGKEAFIFFKEHGLQHNHPCVVYADIETSNEALEDGKKTDQQKQIGSLSQVMSDSFFICLLYTSDAADE